MTLGWRSRGWMLVGFVVASASVVAWFTLREPVANLADRWPPPETLDSLGAYAARSAPMPEIDDYGAYLPALEPAQAYRGPAEPEPPAPAWRLSAILISGNRPSAIIDNRQVRAGDALEGGGTVVRIEPTQVIARDARGREYTLRLSNGG